MKAHYGLAILLARVGEREASREVFTVYQRLYQEDQVRTRRNELDKGEIDRARDLLQRGEVEAALAHLENACRVGRYATGRGASPLRNR